MNKKYKVGESIYCVEEYSYDIQLTKRKIYHVHQVGTDSKKGKIRIKGDLGRLVWISDMCFARKNQPEIQSINLDDKIENEENECIEVTITFKNNHKRWLTFMTTKYLKELIESNNDYDYCHYLSKVIYVNLLTSEIVHKTILDLDRKNKLFVTTTKY